MDTSGGENLFHEGKHPAMAQIKSSTQHTNVKTCVHCFASGQCTVFHSHSASAVQMNIQRHQEHWSLGSQRNIHLHFPSQTPRNLIDAFSCNAAGKATEHRRPA